MNIKREAPLHIRVPHPGFHQEGVGYVPEGRGDHQADPHHVHEYHIQKKLYESKEMDS